VYILSEVSFDLSFFPNMHKIHQRVIGKSSFKYFLRTANEIIGTFWFCLFGVYLFSCLVSDNFWSLPRLGHRMTFSDAFQFANENLKGRTVAVGEWSVVCLCFWHRCDVLCSFLKVWMS
jgi:hypothetical protein